jgi:hypothetical protein
MPVHRGKDAKGPFYQWGNRAKYYYKPGDAKSRNDAYAKASAQAKAIFAHGWAKN